MFDETGKLVRVIANIRDLTELNSLKRQLTESALKLALYHDELARLKTQMSTDGIIFVSAELQKVLDLALRVAPVDTTVLITGESGVGKEVIAKIIYETSKRSKAPFIKINCGAIPPSLIESELFGYEEGAFTGAKRKGKAGIFEIASGGTLLLDEIGDLALDMQVKLLRVIQEQEVRRIGGIKPIKVDVRFIASTNQSLQKLIELGQFRKDLFSGLM